MITAGAVQIGADEVGVVRCELVGDGCGGMNDHHLFGYNRGSTSGGPEFDGAAVVDGVLTGRGGGR